MRIRIIYFIEEALASFRQNLVMSLAAIVVVLFSVLLVGGFVLLGHVVSNATSEIESKVEIEVFLKDNAPQEDVYALERKIKALKSVSQVEYVSKKEALQIFKKRNQNNQALISYIPGNPLPASYRVFLKNPQKVEDVANKISLLPERQTAVEKEDGIIYGKQIVKKIFAVTNWFRFFMLVGVVLLSVLSLILISYTVRLTIYARRKEIAIMRLVGASNWFIRWPFILEGLIQGLAGAILAIGVLSIVKRMLQGKLESSVQLLSNLQVSPATYQNLLLMLLASGVIIGAAGSFIGLRRYLKI